MSVSVNGIPLCCSKPSGDFSLHFRWNLRPSQGHLGSTWFASTPCPFCPRPTSFCSELQTNSFHSRPVHGLLRHLGHPSSIPFSCLSHRLGSKTRFLFFSLIRVYSQPSQCLLWVVFKYSILCLLHLVLQPKTCGAASPYRQAPFWAQEKVLVTAGKVLVLMELSLWGNDRQGSIQSSSKEHTWKMFDCHHPWAEQHTQLGALTESPPLGKQSQRLPSGGDSYAENWRWEGVSLRKTW